MSSITASCANFQFVLDAALESYTKQTGIDLTKHPSADKLQYCHSPEDIVELLLERETAFKDYRNKYGKLIDCLRPAAQIVHVFSGALGEATGVSKAREKFSLSNHDYRCYSNRQKRYLSVLMFSSQFVSPFSSPLLI